eukprot:77950-Chlamydomonas_euryale.AAC.1
MGGNGENVCGGGEKEVRAWVAASRSTWQSRRTRRSAATSRWGELGKQMERGGGEKRRSEQLR